MEEEEKEKVRWWVQHLGMLTALRVLHARMLHRGGSRQAGHLQPAFRRTFPSKNVF